MKYLAITLPDRIEIVKTLEKEIGVPITIFNAIQGKDFLEDFKDFKHPLSDEPITPGMIGCVLSHMTLLKEAKTDILIFEDDCEYVSDYSEFIRNIPNFDILCLGTNENVEYELQGNSNYVKIKRFWGTHAILIKYSAIEGILKTYEKYKSRKRFLPPDWIYNYAIREYNLRVYAPKNPKQFFKQKSGLVSTVNGLVRN
jgi:GR25 family glycosyltransferase involved in LPS biosynthesis